MNPRSIYSFIVISVLIISFVLFHTNIIEGNRGFHNGGGGSHNGESGSRGGHVSHGYHTGRSHHGTHSHDRTSRHGYRHSSYYGGIGNNQGGAYAFNPLYYAPLYYAYYQPEYLPEYYPREEKLEEDNWFTSLFL